MASIRPTSNGRFELVVRNKLLPKPIYYRFDTEDEARAYGRQCEQWLKAGIIPDSLKQNVLPSSELLGPIIRAFATSGEPAVTEVPTLDLLFAEVGKTDVSELTLHWAEKWIKAMKRAKNYAPGTIRKRVQALDRALSWHLRRNPGSFANPLDLLPRGYSTYNEQDTAAVEALGKSARIDTERDRRLEPGEDERIMSALAGVKREDRERALNDEDRDSLRLLYLLILATGVRLREGYMIRRQGVDLARRVLKLQSSKQWRGRVRYREIPMRPKIHAELVQYMNDHPGEPGDLLLPFWDDSHSSLDVVTSRLSHRFTRLFEYAGCMDLREHDLRHEATCRWFELRDAAGNWMLREVEINRIMGWRPGSKMAQRYASFRAEDLTNRLWAAHDGAAKAVNGELAQAA